ncbi:hypothetical protein CDD81_1289 [Ophiocordyceps australis]|uniref:Uncharacterized protein n=1 Tax=Ophiocordyceps australis TaxID=1399860 RepID=A0A2C5Y1J5_9HYPO|nr:hypothetical protein CDD81_1289 [Ophiocordyceps australis]
MGTSTLLLAHQALQLVIYASASSMEPFCMGRRRPLARFTAGPNSQGPLVKRRVIGPLESRSICAAIGCHSRIHWAEERGRQEGERDEMVPTSQANVAYDPDLTRDLTGAGTVCNMAHKDPDFCRLIYDTQQGIVHVTLVL